MNNIINKLNYKDCCEILIDKEIFIKDVFNSKCEISNENDYQVKVINNKNQNISFLKIDKCVFNDADQEKCDCAIANKDKIYFVEIKELEFFDDTQKSHNKKNKKRKEAKSQLSSTINKFKENHSNLDLKNVFPVIALNPKFQDKYMQIITSKTQTVIDSFFESCRCPNIFEGNVIDFK